MSKRKGSDCINSSNITTTSSSSSSSYDNEWLETRQKLKECQRSFSMDDLLSSFDTCLSLQQDLQEQQSSVIVASQDIKNQLDTRIEMAREACKQESDSLYRMQLTLEQFQADRQALLESLQETLSLQTEIKERILQYKELASQTLEEMDLVEAERMRQVPRLKQQISLYATTTGIKWDFDEEDVLAGQVAVQPKGGIKRFCIDPSEYTDFEIANHLWSLMEKGTYADAETSTVGMSAE